MVCLALPIQPITPAASPSKAVYPMHPMASAGSADALRERAGYRSTRLPDFYLTRDVW